MSSTTQVQSFDWGTTPQGEAVHLFTLRNTQVEASITTFGARLTSVRTHDRKGTLSEITLGADELAPYLTGKGYLGATIGRVGNRIAEGRFTLDGTAYQIPLNNGPNALHGGTIGFDQKVWAAKEIPDGVELSYVSPDGEMGFPGTLHVTVSYILTDNSLRLDYEATTDRPTVVSLTNHAYWNLTGELRDLSHHLLRLNAESFTPVDDTLITTGELRPVAGTPHDFRSAKEIGLQWDNDDEQLKLAGGYDHNWVLVGSDDSLHLAAEVTESVSGRTMQVFTTEPGVQFYSGNFLDGSFQGRGGAAFKKRSAFCLETQHFPNSPNQAKFPSTRLEPGVVLRSTTMHRFSVS
jgi:aldose 1-epimerase